LDSDWDSDVPDSSDDEEVKAAKRDAQTEDPSDPRRARDILLYGVPPQPSSAETRMLRNELQTKKAKKEAKKKAKKEAALTLSDSDSDVDEKKVAHCHCPLPLLTMYTGAHVLFIQL
jgi:hypothetical protein